MTVARIFTCAAAEQSPDGENATARSASGGGVAESALQDEATLDTTASNVDANKQAHSVVHVTTYEPLTWGATGVSGG